MEVRKPSRPSGRPRSFDLDKALGAAMHLFWRKGYEGASISGLTRAMGINRPSLYGTFGDKETLFRKALERYTEGPAAYLRESLTQPTARLVAEHLLSRTVDFLTNPKYPSGCLMVQGALACGETSDCIRQELASQRRAWEAAIRRRFKRAKTEGDLPPQSSPTDLARYVITIANGMAVQAAGGASRPELHRVGETAMRAWPD